MNDKLEPNICLEFNLYFWINAPGVTVVRRLKNLFTYKVKVR